MLVPDNIRQNIQGLFAPEENHAKFSEGDQNAKKVTIKSVTFTYQGKEDDFLVFLNAIVRDYLTADDPAQPAAEAFVGKVESGAA